MEHATGEIRPKSWMRGGGARRYGHCDHLDDGGRGGGYGGRSPNRSGSPLTRRISPPIRRPRSLSNSGSRSRT